MKQRRTDRTPGMKAMIVLAVTVDWTGGSWNNLDLAGLKICIATQRQVVNFLEFWNKETFGKQKNRMAYKRKQVLVKGTKEQYIN